MDLIIDSSRLMDYDLLIDPQISIYVHNMNSIALEKTPEQVKAEFVRKGISVRGWAIANGFNPGLVHEILSGRNNRICARGQSHKIAVRLGLKKGEIIDSIEHAFEEAA